MSSSHGWAEIRRERKAEIVNAICAGVATQGPSHVELDLTDRCNVACYFCNQQDLRTKEQLPLATILPLLDELVESGLKSVRLSGGGDPLFHREILTVIEALTARRVVVDNLTTNGALLTAEVADRLIENGCREVLFSLNAADPADYHRMMKVKPETFDRVVENARRLVEKRGGETPVVTVQFLLDRENGSKLVEMYRVAQSVGADRVAISPVLEIPFDRVDKEEVLGPADWDLLAPGFRAILALDAEAKILDLFFPFEQWNQGLSRLRQAGDLPAAKGLQTAPSFAEKNGHCFFAWYSATIRGNGDLYPCCMLLNPTYKPLGNVRQGTFQSHWHGPAFTRLRHEMREVFLVAGRLFQPQGRFQHLAPQCIEAHRCGLKNMYFRGDEEFYSELAVALGRTRGREVRWLGSPRQSARAAEALAFRVYYGLRTRLRTVWHRVRAWRRRPG